MTTDQPHIVFMLGGGIIGQHGVEVACPQCGETKLLEVRACPDENNEEPSYVRDLHGHAWAEPALPRSWFAEPVAQLIAGDPERWEQLARRAVDSPGRYLRLDVPGVPS